MQIKQISLFGKNNKRRDVNFNLSELNIITGASKKGKSSLLEIVEYCLGSSECGVAAGHIKKTVSWFGVLFQFEDVQTFIARKAPILGAKSNSEVCLIAGSEVDVPTSEDLKGNTNIDSAMKFMADKLGIPEQVTEVPDGQTRSVINLAFKHSKFFLFQSQDEIANKRTLFHRQAEPFIPQTIKDILPYFLGAAEDDRFIELEKLRALKRDKAKKFKELREIESLKGDGLRKGYQLLAEASQVGLYDGITFSLSDARLIEELTRISAWEPSSKPYSKDNQEALQQLDSEYQLLRQNKKLLNSQLKETEDYSKAVGGFESEGREQMLRLTSVKLFEKLETHEVPYKDQIISSLKALDSQLANAKRVKPKLSSRLSDIKTQRTEVAKKIKDAQDIMNSFRKADEESVKLHEVEINRAKVAGRVSLYIDGVDWQKDTSSLKSVIKNLEWKIKELEEKLDPEVLQERLDAQINLIGLDMTKWANELNLEHSEHPIKLDLKKLTVVAETPEGKVPLYQMGSGENWVGYHLVTYLSLAKWFIKRLRPVPRFVFFDQPTQVYFPTDLDVTGDISEISDDEDRVAVKKMFQWLNNTLNNELAGKFQIIITDHADIDEPWFQRAVRDEKWRGNKALIPLDWIEDKQ